LAGVDGDEAERAIDEKDGETGGDRVDEVGDDRLGAGRREGGDDGDDEEGGRRFGGGDGLAGGGAPIGSNSGARRPVVNDPKPDFSNPTPRSGGQTQGEGRTITTI
jgi:hypothetical protein